MATTQATNETVSTDEQPAVAAETPHDVALDAYDPDPLPDWDVYRVVVNESADTLEALIEEVY